MILSLLLAASGPADFNASFFVDDPHTHEWEFLGEEESGKVWWDRHAIGNAVVGDEDYPTVLLRVIANKDHWMSQLFVYQDIITAVDCDNNQMAEIDEIRNGQRVDDPWADVREAPKFGPLPYPEKAEVQSMMQAVCGEDWSS